jgi:hypothetical protein
MCVPTMCVPTMCVPTMCALLNAQPILSPKIASQFYQLPILVCPSLSIQQRPSSEANRFSASQESRILLNPTFITEFPRALYLPILNQINPINAYHNSY